MPLNAGAAKRTKASKPGVLVAWARRLGPVAGAALVVIVLLALMAVFAQLIAPYPPNLVDLGAANQGPSPQHLLGTDSTGRDLLTRLIYGARISLLGPLGVVALAIFLGVSTALVSVWWGGRVDAFISRVTDILFSFPALLLAIVAVAIFGKGLVAPGIALAIAFTPYVARLTRAPALRLRQMPFIAALEVQGFSALSISLRHMVPNLAPFIAGQATILFGTAMIDLAALSFLGLGVQPPTAEWGAMVSAGQTSIIAGYPYESISAGLMIVIAVVSFNLLGQRLSETARFSGGAS
ncbi:MAG: ABC transporter permease [Candidatus Leucobacter sulfamidivorax]|nr:ABC transporter permease [Candidatus Leucobacter sulfamidivorax]